MLKNVELNFEGISYSCELKPDTNDAIICNIYKISFLNFEGKITLKDVYTQIIAFEDYSMEELFNILKDIEKEKFEIVNSSNKYNLKILIKILKKEKELNIPLEKKSQSNAEILQFILKEIKIQEKQIESLEKKMPILRKLFKYPNIDISKMNLQREKEIFGKGKLPELIRGLKSGKIAISIYNNGIAIIDPETLEISFMIEEPCLTFIELQKDIIALIKRIEYDKNQILVIKIEEKNYKVLKKSYISNYNRLFKLWDETLITSDNKGIYFFKENNDLSKHYNLSIKFKEDNSFISSVIQTQKNEIVYDPNKLIFYDFVKKKEKKIIEFYFNISSKLEMISDELLCIIDSYSANLFNVYTYEKVKTIKLDDKAPRAIYCIKEKYLIILRDECLKQYRIEQDNISLMHERDISNNILGFIFLNIKKKEKFISYDKNSIYEFY